MLRNALSVLAVLVPFTAASALPPESDRWHERAAPNVRVLSNGPEAAGLAVALRLERLRHALGLLTPGLKLGSGAPVDVVLFRDEASFRPYARVLAASDPSRPAGYYRSAEYQDVLAVVPVRRDEDFLEHAVAAWLSDGLRSTFPTGPAWLREGLAQIYAAARTEGGRVEVGRPIGGHLRLLRERTALPCRELLVAMRPIGPEPEVIGRTSLFQAQSWALAAYLLVESTDTRARTVEFARRVSGGADPAEAWSATVAIEPERLDAELAAFVRRESFAYYAIPVDGVAIDAPPRELPRHEVLGRLGWLLVALDPVNAPAAEAHFQAALALRGDYAPALAGLGRLRSRAGDVAGATAFYDRALAANPADTVVALLAARSLVASEPARARALLETVVATEPGNAEALAALGATYVADSGDPAPGIAALEQAAKRLPPRADLLLNLAALRARAGDRDGAEAIVDGPLAELGDPAAVAAGRERVALAEFPAINARIAAGDLEGALEILRRGRDDAPTDAIRARFDGEIARIEPVARRNRHAAQFNEAAAKANRGDWKGAGALCETILADAPDDDLRTRAEDLLARARRAGSGGKR